MKLEYFIESVEDYLIKCTDYPKYQALKYFKEHKDDFQLESYTNGNDLIGRKSPVGHLQQLQENLQDNVDYTDLEKSANHHYSTDMFTELQKYNNETDDWEEYVEDYGVYDENGELGLPLINHYGGDWTVQWRDAIIDDAFFDSANWGIADVSMENISNLISRAISKSPTLQQDTVMYRWGRLPDDLMEEQYSTFKGFTGLSYNEKVPEYLEENMHWNESARYQIKVYAMKGTKGMVLYPHNGCEDWQSEWLLDKNQKYVLLNRNDEDMTAEILLY